MGRDAVLAFAAEGARVLATDIDPMGRRGTRDDIAPLLICLLA